MILRSFGVLLPPGLMACDGVLVGSEMCALILSLAPLLCPFSATYSHNALSGILVLSPERDGSRGGG